jgi:hypothetical protein
MDQQSPHRLGLDAGHSAESDRRGSVVMKRMLLLSCVALLTSACAMTKAKIDKDITSKTKKVAIVAFNMEVQEPKSLVGDLKKIGDLGEGKIRDAIEQHQAADDLYRELSTKLAREMNWDIKSQQAVSANAYYKTLLKQHTEGLQVGSYKPLDYHTMRPHGILHADPAIHKVKREERDKLMSELGVDALVVDFTTVSLRDKSWFGGMIGRSKYLPKAQNVIRVFVRGKEDPVWFDTWAWGEGEKALQANFNHVEDKPLLEQVVLASKRSISETMSRYKSH